MHADSHRTDVSSQSDARLQGMWLRCSLACNGPEACWSCRYRWFGLAPRNLDWWGAISYTVGVGLYWIAAVSTMINDCPNSLMAPDVYVSRLT